MGPRGRPRPKRRAAYSTAKAIAHTATSVTNVWTMYPPYGLKARAPYHAGLVQRGPMKVRAVVGWGLVCAFSVSGCDSCKALLNRNKDAGIEAGAGDADGGDE